MLRRLLFATFLLAACDRSDAGFDVVTRVPGTQIVDPAALPSPAPSPAPTAEAQAGLALLDAGAEPRFALHYQATQGHHEAMALSMGMTMTMPPDPPIVFPQMTLGADVAATAVAGDGTTTLVLTLTIADVQDTKDSMVSADEVRAQMGDVVGLETTMKVDRHGHLSDVEGTAISQALQQSQMGFDQLVTALPTEPVGKGARWRLTQTIDQGAMKVDQVLVVEVLEVTATTTHLHAVGTMTAPHQRVVWQGVQVDLDGTTGTSENDLQIDFTSLVPTVRGTVEMTTRMSARGERSEMTTKSVMTMRPR